MHSEIGRDLIYCHWHPNLEIIHVTSGQVDIRLDSHWIHLNTGDICIVNPNQVHYGNPVEGSNASVHLVVLSYDILPYSKDDRYFLKYIYPLTQGDMLLPDVFRLPTDEKNTPSWQRACHNHLLDLIASGDRPFSGRELAVQGIFLQFLSTLYHHQQLIQSHEVEYRLISPRNRAILDYMEANYRSNLGIPEIASKFDINTDYFHRLFKSLTGQTPTIFINQRRIRAAKQLLKKTSMPIGEIAFQSGFHSSSYFSKIFYRFEGTTPRSYRNESI